MNIMSTDQEKHYFLNMCILCRYARFLQAQSHLPIMSVLCLMLWDAYYALKQVKILPE